MPKSLSKTPAPKKDRIYGSKVNPKGSASSEKSATKIKLSSDIILALTKKLKEFKETHKTKKVSLSDLKAVYRRGLGAYSSTHRPTISGGKPNTRNAWAMARVNAFLRKAGGGEAKKSYVQDDDLLKYADGGEVKSFYRWYMDWYKTIKDEITLMVSFPNKLQPFSENNVVIIDKFKKDRESIKANRYLQEFIDKADEFGITIYLEPKPIGNVKTKSELINYYTKFGFELTPNKQFMKRVPKYANGGEVDEHKETYKKWKSLVNMSYSELKRFYDSEEGKQAGLKPSEAKAQGIDSGRESARWILKMKKTPVSEWTPNMWRWANKQISFISRMSGMKGDLYDDKGRKTRKYLSLLIWGNDPKKKNVGGDIDVRMEDTVQRMDDPHFADISYYAKGGDVYEYTLWGVKNGEPDYAEVLLSTQKQNFEKVKKLASKDGYGRFRESKIDMREKPDFTKAIKKENGGQTDKYEISDYWDIESFADGGEVKTKKIITEKIGYSEDIADYLINISPKLAIWIADSIMKADIQGYKEEQERRGLPFKLADAKKEVLSQYSNSSQFRNYYQSDIRKVLDWLQHPITPKQNLRELGWNEALDKAEQWHTELTTLGGDIDFKEPEENEILYTYPKDKDGAEFYWVQIPSNFCSLESSRMGHCGRTGYGNILLSLRSVKPFGKGHTINDSHVTIAYNEKDGIFYQVKGKKNQKPTEKYFPYIFDLILKFSTSDRKLKIIDYEKEIDDFEKDSNRYEQIIVDLREQYKDLMRQKDRLNEIQTTVKNNREYSEIENEIKNIYLTTDKIASDISETKLLLTATTNSINTRKDIIDDINKMSQYAFNGFGTEYDSSEDYGYEDMSMIQIDELYKIRPDLFSGLQGQFALYDKGIIREKPNTKFVIQKDAENVADLIDINNSDVTEGFIKTLLIEGIYEFYNSYNRGYDELVKFYLDDLNEKNMNNVLEKISDITEESLDVVKENGAEYYLSGESDYEQDDFEEIFSSLNMAINYAEEQDLYEYYYKQIKDSLSELGEVEYLNDEGTKINIDLSDLLTIKEISNYLKELGDNVTLLDVYFEAEYNGDIRLPKISIDDRYSPSADRQSINENFDIHNYKNGGTINQSINTNIMDEVKFNQLPHIDTINNNDKIIIHESVFAGSLDKPKHIGERYIHCEVMGKGGMVNSLNLKVLNSLGANALRVGEVITRPVSNVLTKGRKLIVEPIAQAMPSFKQGGLNPDNKEVKQYFAHDSGNAGGVLVGKRHSEGGIKAINKSTGQPLEMEGGEVVITRGAVSNPKKYDFQGKDMTTREILSKLNVDGGGVSFAEGGDVPDKMNCGCDKMDFGGSTMSVQDFVNRSDSEYQEYRLIEGIKKERHDHYDTLSKLNAGTITIDQALGEIAKKEMKLDSKYPFAE